MQQIYDKNTWYWFWVWGSGICCLLLLLPSWNSYTKSRRTELLRRPGRVIIDVVVLCACFPWRFLRALFTFLPLPAGIPYVTV